MPPVRPEALLVPLALLWVGAAEGVFVPPWVAAVTAAVLGALAWRRLVRGVRVGPGFFWLLGLGLWVLVSALGQPVPWDRAAQLGAVAVFAVLLAVVAAHPSGQRWLAAGVVAAGVLGGVWLVVEWVVVGGRPAGPFANPNLAASVALVASAHAVQARGWLPGVTVPVLAAGILAAQSRAALLAAAVLCGFWLLFRASPRQRAAVTGLAALAVAAFAWRLWSDPDPLRFQRVRIWQTALRVAWDFAPWGTGPGGFAEAAVARNFPREGEFARYHRVPDLAESDLLQLAASLGLPGLVLGGGLGWWIFRGWGRRDPKRGPGLVLAVTGAFHSQLLWPVVAFLAVAAGRYSGRFRFRLSPTHAFVLLWPLVVWGSVVLPWPETVLGRSSQDRLAAVREVLVRERDPGALADALVEATAVARTDPRSGEVQRILGRVKVQLARATGDARAAEAAVASFRRAQAINPNDVWAFLGEAEAWTVLGQWERVRGAASRALQVEPHCVPCWLTLAQAQLFLGLPEQGREAYGKALAAQRMARGYPFVSAYERALAAADPVWQARLAKALREGP